MTTQDNLEDLMYSEEYMEYIMAHGDKICPNGDTLLDLAEDGYLFEEFIKSIGYESSNYFKNQ